MFQAQLGWQERFINGLSNTLHDKWTRSVFFIFALNNSIINNIHDPYFGIPPCWEGYKQSSLITNKPTLVQVVTHGNMSVVNLLCWLQFDRHFFERLALYFFSEDFFYSMSIPYFTDVNFEMFSWQVAPAATDNTLSPFSAPLQPWQTKVSHWGTFIGCRLRTRWM